MQLIQSVPKDFWYSLLAAMVAGGVTFLDIDQTFDYIPPQKVSKRWLLRSLSLGFVVLNATFAGLLYAGLKDNENLSGFTAWQRAIIVGASYLALVRQKFANISTRNSQEESFGIEFLYNAAKNSVYKRINLIAKDALKKEISELLSTKSLNELGQEAVLSINTDNLLRPAEREDSLRYIDDTLKDSASDEGTRKQTLALFLLTQRRDRL